MYLQDHTNGNNSIYYTDDKANAVLTLDLPAVQTETKKLCNGTGYVMSSVMEFPKGNPRPKSRRGGGTLKGLTSVPRRTTANQGGLRRAWLTEGDWGGPGRTETDQAGPIDSIKIHVRIVFK